jgi:hypothetical protein
MLRLTHLKIITSDSRLMFKEKLLTLFLHSQWISYRNCQALIVNIVPDKILLNKPWDAYNSNYVQRGRVTLKFLSTLFLSFFILLVVLSLITFYQIIARKIKDAFMSSDSLSTDQLFRTTMTLKITIVVVEISTLRYPWIKCKLCNQVPDPIWFAFK